MRARKRCSRRELVPAHLIGNAPQHGEHGIVFGEDAANGICGVHAQRLQFAQQKQAEHVIDVGVERERLRRWATDELSFR